MKLLLSFTFEIFKSSKFLFSIKLDLKKKEKKKKKKPIALSNLIHTLLLKQNFRISIKGKPWTFIITKITLFLTTNHNH